MELEVGLRITRDAAGDITFASSETEAVLITAAHLPGFSRDLIEVTMNEGERKLSIRGHIASQEVVITTSRVVITRELLVHRFEETFSVPDNVDWDGIDAWLDEENEILIISIPKSTTNECLWNEAEETSEVAMKEEGQISKKLVLRELREQKEEINLHMELPHKVKEKAEELQANTRLTQWPSMPEEQLQSGERDAENKAAAHPQYAADEETQESASQRGRPMQTEAELHISYQETWENDLESKGALREVQLREGYGKPLEGIEDERNMILEWMGSDAQEKNKTPTMRPTFQEQPSQREEHKEHKTPIMRPTDQEQEAMLLPEIKKPWDPSQARQCKSIGVTTEPDTRKPSKQIETLQQLQTTKYEQKHERPQAMGTDQVLEAKQLIKPKEDEELGKKEKEKDEKFGTKKFKDSEKQMPKAAHQCFHSELQEESKQNEKGVQKHELHKDEENRWMGLDTEISKTEKSLSSKEVSQAFLFDKKQSATKLTKTVRPVQEQEELRVKAPDQVLEATKQIQSEDIKGKLKHDKEVEHKKEVKQHEEFIVTPTYMKPKVAGMIENEVNKPELYVAMENEQQEQPKGIIQSQQEKIDNTMQSTEQKKLDRTIEKPRVRAPNKVLETAKHIQSEEFSSKIQKHEQEMLKLDKSTVKEPNKMLESAELAKSENKEKLIEHELQKSQVRAPVKIPEAAPQIYSKIQKEVQQLIDPDSQLLKSLTEVSKTEESLKPQEGTQSFQQEKEKMTQETEKPTVKAYKKHLEVVEPEKPEDKEEKKEVEQLEEQQAQECKKTIIGSPLEEFTVEEPYQTPGMIDFTALEKQVLMALKELDSNGISKQQEQCQNKGSKEIEKHDEGSLTKAQNIEELRSSGNPEMHNKIKLSADPEKFPKLIHSDKEFQKSQLYKEIRESVETNQEIFQEREEEAPIEGAQKTNGLPESQEPYKKPEEDLQLEHPKEEEAENRRCPAVESETSNKSAVETTTLKSKTNEREKFVREEDFYQQEEDAEQSTKSSKSWKQPTKSKQPIDLEGPGLQISMDEAAQKQPKVEQAARNTTLNEAVKEQELYRPEKQEVEAIESQKLQKNPTLIQTELPILLHGIKGIMASKEAAESPCPASFQTELLQSFTNLQNLEEIKAAQRQIPVFKRSTPNKVGKTKEEIQEQSSSPLFVGGIKALEEIQRREEASSREDEETSRAEIIKCAKASRQKRRRRFHRHRSGRDPAFPFSPSKLFAGSAFGFSVMVLFFHFIKPKKYN